MSKEVSNEKELSVINDVLNEYGQVNITRPEYNMIYNKAINDFVELYKSKTRMEQLLVEEIAEQLRRGGVE